MVSPFAATVHLGIPCIASSIPIYLSLDMYKGIA